MRRNGERKFHNWKKNASFFYGNGHARSSIYRDIKKEEEREREREREKEGSFVDYSI